MNITKPLTSALLAGGLVLGSFGAASVASAQYGGEEPAPTPTTDIEDVSDIDALSVQLEEDTETETEGDNDGRRGCGDKHEAAAEAIGITVDELREGRDAGQSLAEIAEANGSSAQAVVDALIANAEERIDAKVASGDLTEEEAAEKLAEKSERIEAKVDAEPGERGQRGVRGERGDQNQEATI